jgi:hypothetical protein
MILLRAKQSASLHANPSLLSNPSLLCPICQ